MNQNYKLLLSCLSFLMAFASFSQTIIRGPYLQKGTPNSVVVKWRTDSPTSSKIEYSTNTSYSSSLSDASSKTDHELEITGLSPNTKYFYRIGTNGSLLSGSTDLYFKTHPNIGTSAPYTFWILGHTGKSGIKSQSYDVRDAYINYIGSNETSGMIITGDNADSKGYDTQYQSHLFDFYGSKLKNTILWSCFGNIDGNNIPGTSPNSPYYDIFTFPENGESGGISSGTESYYSFDYGNIHFIVLNSFHEDRSIGGTMYNWAQNDIQSTTQKWIVAIWHHPPYSKGWHTSEGTQGNGDPAEIELIEMRQNFLPMLEGNGVDLVVAGHSESYERSYLINGHYGESASFDPVTNTIGTNGYGDGKADSIDGAYSKTAIGPDAGKGAVYVVTSTASQIVSAPLDHNAMYYSVSKYGSCVLEVDGNNLTLKFLRDTGVIEDYFTLRKGDNYVYNNGWQGGTDPNGNATVEDDILIESGNATITSNTNSNIVVVNPGSGLTINSSKTLTVTNSLNLNSTSSTYSSLILDGSISGAGTINYNRFTNQEGSGTSGGNDLVSSPLSAGTMETFGTFAAANPNLAASNDLRAFAPYNNTSGLYENYDVNTNSSTNLEAGKGYRAATSDGSPLKFTGLVNSGTETVNITFGTSGWNLIGNPYPSYIDAQDFLNYQISSSPTVYNSDLLVDANKAIYGYDGNASDGWVIWNNLTGAQIAPGQGFFVNASNSGTLIADYDIEFDPSIRSFGTGDDFIAGRSSTNIALTKLNMTKSSNNYHTDIYFTDSGTKGLDPGYDAGAFQDNASGIFTHLVNDNAGIEMAIQALPYEDFNNVVVPLGIKADAGEQISIGIDDSSTVPGNIKIYLEDNVANTLTLLNMSDYIFTPTEELNGVGRFFIHYSSTTLSLNDENFSGLQIFTSTNPKLLHINGKLTESSILDLYDTQGRLVLSKNLDVNSISNIIGIESLGVGIYIVKLQTGGLTRAQKVIIR